jgi:hypothetical protein
MITSGNFTDLYEYFRKKGADTIVLHQFDGIRFVLTVLGNNILLGFDNISLNESAAIEIVRAVLSTVRKQKQQENFYLPIIVHPPLPGFHDISDGIFPTADHIILNSLRRVLYTVERQLDYPL